VRKWWSRFTGHISRSHICINLLKKSEYMRWLFHSAHKDVYIRLKVHSRYRTVGFDITLATLWVFLEMISSANHLSDTSKTKYNHIIQPSDNTTNLNNNLWTLLTCAKLNLVQIAEMQLNLLFSAALVRNNITWHRQVYHQYSVYKYPGNNRYNELFLHAELTKRNDRHSHSSAVS